MEPISVTLSAGGQPFLTTRLRSILVQDAASGARPDRAANAGATGQSRESTSSEPAAKQTGFIAERSGGLGDAGRQNLFLSQAGDEPVAQSSGLGADGLTDAEREQVEKLKARDAEVRRHEQAHAAVGGQYAGAPSYTYQQGPDGRRYAIGGEVMIDVAPIPDDPEATIEKMGVVKAAALAPAEPSAADRRVAALADAQRLQAVAELASLRTEASLERVEGAPVATTADQGFMSADGKPEADTRLAMAANMLARGEDAMPGKRLNVTA